MPGVVRAAAQRGRQPVLQAPSAPPPASSPWRAARGWRAPATRAARGRPSPGGRAGRSGRGAPTPGRAPAARRPSRSAAPPGSPTPGRRPARPHEAVLAEREAVGVRQREPVPVVRVGAEHRPDHAAPVAEAVPHAEQAAGGAAQLVVLVDPGVEGVPGGAVVALQGEAPGLADGVEHGRGRGERACKAAIRQPCDLVRGAAPGVEQPGQRHAVAALERPAGGIDFGAVVGQRRDAGGGVGRAAAGEGQADRAGAIAIQQRIEPDRGRVGRARRLRDDAGRAGGVQVPGARARCDRPAGRSQLDQRRAAGDRGDGRGRLSRQARCARPPDQLGAGIQVRDARQFRPGRLDHHAAVVERRCDAGDVDGRQHGAGGARGGGEPRGGDAVETGRVYEHVDGVAPRPGGGDVQLPLAGRDDDQVIDQVPGEREQPPPREPCSRQAGKRIADCDAGLVAHRRSGPSLRCGSRRASSQSSSPNRADRSPRPGERAVGG